MGTALSSLLVTPVAPGAALARIRLRVIYLPSDIGAASSGWPSLVLGGVVVLVGIVVLAIVLLRRRPLISLALLLAGSLLAAAGQGPWSAGSQTVELDPEVLLAVPVLFLLAGAVVSFIAATRPRRVSILAAAAALGVQAGGWAAVSGGSLLETMRRGPASVLGSSPELAVGLITVVAWLIGHSIRQAHVHSSALRARADAQAATAERLRIARDLHDMVAHSVGIIAIQAGMGRRVIDSQPAEAREALATIEATSRETLAGLRRTVGALRRPGPPADADTDPLDIPGLAGLARLAARTLDAGVRVEVRRRGQPRPLPAEVDTSAFRIIQEAVANVVRHADTGRCQVSIDHRDQELSIEVTDDGRGTTAAGTGYGIAGMRERAALLHGDLTAGPRPDGGFRVTARLPLPSAPASPSAAADPLPVRAAPR